jgi:CelD/BcsL family acetyltransferase involved in cellulose biosynthesis/GNAT superfamily N-acetyltransferase
MGNIFVINNVDEFRALKDEWNDFLSTSRTNTIFLTWEWLYTWWEVFGKGAELFIVVSRDEQGKLNGIAPLHIRRTRYYKFPIRELTFIGMGHSDRQDFITDTNDEEITDRLLETAYEHRPKWDVIHLEQIPEHSHLLKSKLAEQLGRFIEKSSVCPFASIEGEWDTFTKNLGKKFRRDIQHKVNRLMRFGQWEFRVDHAANHPREIIALSEKVEKVSRKEGTEKGFLADNLNKEFLSRFGEVCSGKGWFDYSMINLEGSTIAYLIGFIYNSKYYAYNMAFNEAYHEASPGKLLLNEKIKWCFQEPNRIDEFDFLRGAFYLKSLWATDSRQHYRTVMFRRSLYTVIIRAAVFRVRPIIKKAIALFTNIYLKTKLNFKNKGICSAAKWFILEAFKKIILFFYQSIDLKIWSINLYNMADTMHLEKDNFQYKPLTYDQLQKIEWQFGRKVRDDFENRIERGSNGFIVTSGDNIVGYSWSTKNPISEQGAGPFLFDLNPSESNVYFYDDYVIPEMRNKGVCSKLMSFRIRANRKNGFTKAFGIIGKSNIPQIKIHQSLGWTVNGKLTYRRYLWLVKKDTSALTQFCKESDNDLADLSPFKGAP